MVLLAGEFVSKVDFPVFVGNIVKGRFEAIVDITI